MYHKSESLHGLMVQFILENRKGEKQDRFRTKGRATSSVPSSATAILHSFGKVGQVKSSLKHAGGALTLGYLSLLESEGFMRMGMIWKHTDRLNLWLKMDWKERKQHSLGRQKLK